MENIKLVTNSVADTFNVGFQYVLVQCRNCGSKWGVSVSIFANEIAPVDLVCRSCAQKKFLSEIK